MVVSNTSPISNLAAIGRLDLLKRFYGTITIPGAVAEELSAAPSFGPGMILTLGEPWIQVCQVANRALVDSVSQQLAPGEAEAIALAVERHADLLLMDERRGRRAAKGLGLRHVGLLGILAEAKRRGFVPAVRPLLDLLVTRAGFWVSRELYARVLHETGE
jgi:predicted nucleic acid-binding protein